MADYGSRGAFAGSGRGAYNAGSEGGSGAFPGRGAFNAQSSVPGRGAFGAQSSVPGRGAFGAQSSFPGRGAFNAQPSVPGRGAFGAQPSDAGESARGGFGGGRGRGNYNQDSESGQSSRGAFGRGAYGTENGRGAFGRGAANNSGAENGRGAFNNQGSEAVGNFRGGSDRGRGLSNVNSEGGRGTYSGRGASIPDSNAGENSRGAYGGSSRGRGNFNQDADGGQNARGAYVGSTRGNFNQDSENSGYSRGGGSRGGRGYQDAESGNYSRGGYSGRGTSNFAADENSRGAYSGRGQSGNFNQGSNDGGFSRGGARGGRSNYNHDPDGGQNSRGAYGGSTRGNSNQDSESSGFSRGGTRGGRGNFNQNADGQNSRGGFNQDSGFSRGGRGNYSQDADGAQNSRGPFGGGRGARGGNNQARNYGDQENQEGADVPGSFTQNRNGVDVPAAPQGQNGEPLKKSTHVPLVRTIDDLVKEDQDSAAAYAECVDLDDDIVIENSKFDVVRIQSWDEAEFHPQLLDNVKNRSKYTRPRKIQGATIPLILDNWDVKAQAETGSGKTAAFLLPILDTCIKAKRSPGPDRFVSDLATPYALIIGPTRELVLQVYEQALKLANGTGVSIAKAYGQYNINRNHEEIRNGCDILVGTVGRLKHFIMNEDIFVQKIRYLVLDEADRLLDQSFGADIEAITNNARFPPKENRVTMLFSATFDNAVMEIADQMLKPDAIFVTNHRNDPNKKIVQDFIVVDPVKPRVEVLKDLLKEELDKVGSPEKMRKTLVFVNTKRSSDLTAIYLSNSGIPATSINGDRDQNLREEALRDFRNGRVSVLVSTDVTARGIDVKHLDHVINFELPPHDSAITYVHRIGRTGRITQGYATTLIDGSEPILNEIANMLRKMGTVPETLEKVLAGGVAAAPSNSVPVAPPSFSGYQAAAVAAPFVDNEDF